MKNLLVSSVAKEVPKAFKLSGKITMINESYDESFLNSNKGGQNKIF